MDNIDLIPKKPKEEPFWQELLFYISFLFLAISLIFCIGLSVLAKRSSLELEGVNNELAKEKTSDQIKTETEVLIYKKKISAFSILLKQRKPLSRIFDFLEKKIHPGIVFTKMAFVADEDKLQISGMDDDFQALGQQVFIFRKNSLIKLIDLRQVGIGKTGGIEFSFAIVFDKKIFEEKEEASAETPVSESEEGLIESPSPEITPEVPEGTPLE